MLSQLIKIFQRQNLHNSANNNLILNVKLKEDATIRLVLKYLHLVFYNILVKFIQELYMTEPKLL
jgi:hypothetical protein